MVHQHFMLVPVFTVAENVMLGREQTRGMGVLNRRQAAERVRELSERYRLKVDPDRLVEDLPVGVQQRVEIIKALANDAKVLILDEPTAVLTPQEIDELMEIMRELKARARRSSSSPTSCVRSRPSATGSRSSGAARSSAPRRPTRPRPSSPR